MRRLIAFFLVAVIIFNFCGCKKEVKIDPVTPEQIDGVYQLKEPGHVVFMQENPEENYALVADIDMQGVTWRPIDLFSGTLTGIAGGVYNNTISNFVLVPDKEDSECGFFRKISGTVSDVNFRNVTVQSEDVFTGSLGIVAGECQTPLVDVDVLDCEMKLTVSKANVGFLCGETMDAVENCYTSGSMNLILKGGKGQIGGMIGSAEGDVTKAESRVDVNITTKVSTAGGVGGVIGCGYGEMTQLNYGGHFNVSAGTEMAASALVGHLEGTLTNSLNCARTLKITKASNESHYYGSKSRSATAATCYTRDVSNLDEYALSDAEYAMRKQAAAYMYQMCTVRWIPVKDMTYTDDCVGDHSQTYQAGQSYFGLPYTHTCGSLERMNAYLNADGTVKSEIPATNWNFFMGNDCADAVYWAWAQFSSQISYTLTSDMICINGVVPVGNYQVTDTTSTKKIVEDNGADIMYEAYAQIKMGDGLLFAPGHLRMAAEAAYIFRDADGKIDPNRSYVLFHEQGTSTDVANTHSTCKVNGKTTFASLLKQNYIPVTIEAFANGKADAPEVSCTNTDLSVNGLCKGTVESNYRINWVTIRILDKKGREVATKTDYPCVGSHITSHNLSMMKKVLEGVSFKSGDTYTYEVLVNAAGQSVTAQKFEFTA